MSIETTQRHIVVIAQEAWGHVRPLCVLVAAMVNARPDILITFFTTVNFHKRVSCELARHLDADVEMSGRIRLIALAVEGQLMQTWTKITAPFSDTYRALDLQQTIICAKTGAEFPPVRAPDAAIVDFFGNNMMDAIREHSVHSRPVKVYIWVSCPVVPILWRFLPVGDRGLVADLQEEVRNSGRSLMDVGGEHFLFPKNKVVQVPGLPPVFDHEFFPQERIVEGPSAGAGLLGICTYHTLNGCDGMILGSPECYELPEVMSVLRDWYERERREVHVVGPLLPTSTHVFDIEEQQSARSAEVQRFLDRAMNVHGAKSLVYISFGSLFWSTEPEKIWTVLDVIIERQVPFIFSHASPFAMVPEAVKLKIAASGLGFLSAWSPQEYILSHPATGWFVTHCGFNSILESISAGVPMICWPFTVDQPISAIHVTHNLGIAYELLEVRTGPGLGPVYRTGVTPLGTLDALRAEVKVVLDRAFGDDGNIKRAKVEKLREEMAHAWSDEGPSRKGLQGFLDNFHQTPRSASFPSDSFRASL